MPQITTEQLELLNTVRDRLLELKDQVDDAIVEIEALIEAVVGPTESTGAVWVTPPVNTRSA